MTSRIALLAATFAVVSLRPLAAVDAMTKDQMKSVVLSDSLTVPTPGEFFAAMDEQGPPNWTQLFSPIPAATTSSREQMALMLGILVADGYLAVEAQDGQGVKNTGKDIINLAKKLNVSQSVLSRGNSINDFVENNDWSALREELEATQNEVKISMTEQKDRDLVVLVTVAAWIRGTQVASGYISKNYSPSLAALLRQPAVVEYLLAELAKLPEKMRGDSLIMQIRKQLTDALTIVHTKDRSPLSEQSVNDLSALMTSLVTQISTDQ